MPKYIEREALIKQFECNGGYTVYGERVVKAVVSRIKIQPTADVVEVVRCKDCANYGEFTFCESFGLNGFCSFGVRSDT